MNESTHGDSKLEERQLILFDSPERDTMCNVTALPQFGCLQAWYDLQVARRCRQHMNSQTSDKRNPNRCEMSGNIQFQKHVPSYKGIWSVCSIHQPFLQFLECIREVAQPWARSHNTSTVLTQSTKSPWTKNSSETSQTYGSIEKLLKIESEQLKNFPIKRHKYKGCKCILRNMSAQVKLSKKAYFTWTTWGL